MTFYKTRSSRFLGSKHLDLAAWIILAFAARPLVAADTPAALDGHWQGTLQTGAVSLRLRFHIAHDPGGQLVASMDSLDQGVKGIPVNGVTLEGKNVEIDVQPVRGSFRGTLSDDGKQLQGTWRQPAAELPLELIRLDELPTDVRPQEPVKPYPYSEEELTYESDAEHQVILAATLTLPKSDRPVPAVVLISGSGPQDRDESIAGHKPFLVLADYLTRRGIAVLRADDRGVGGSTGDPWSATTEAVAHDALAGVAYLKGRSEIDPQRIALIGHSEGANAASLAASRSTDVSVVVLLAGTGVVGEEIILLQGELIAKSAGANPLDIAAAKAANRQITTILKNESDPAAAEKQIRDILEQLAKLSPTPAEVAQAQLDAQIQTVLTPWFRFFVTYDPQPALRALRCPVLVLNGEKDLQVDPQQNLPPIEAALQQGGNTDYTIKQLPGLNHLFQTCETGALSEYAQIDETLSPIMLELLATWLRERMKP